MRPIELFLEGLTSFRSEQRLDFSDLDLFAITGATGAGKSSLLDAMTYALYGTTARTGKQVSELVSQGAKNLRVQLRFSVGDGEYRVTRQWRYRPSAPVTTVVLEGWQNNTWEPLSTSSASVQKTIEQIVGMDFDTFTRVILLPQGQFDEFLKGDKAKRREILRQLAGFEIFEKMRSEAGEIARGLTKEREAIARQLNDLQAPPIEAVEEKKLLLAATEIELPILNEGVLKAQKALDFEEQLFAQLTRLRLLQEEFSTLQASSEKIAALEERLKRSQAANQLQGNWAILSEARYQDATASSVAVEASQQLRRAGQQLEIEQKNFEEIRDRAEAIAPQFKAREDALATAKVYAQQQQQLAEEIERLQLNLKQKTAHLEAAEREFKAATLQKEATQQKMLAATAALSQHKPGGDRLAILNQVAPLLGECKFLSKQVKKNRDNLENIAARILAATKNHQVIIAKKEATETAFKNAHRELELAEFNNAEAARSEQAAALRASLKSGDNCPVCGSIHPPSDRLPPLPPSTLVEISPLREREAVAAMARQAIFAEFSKAEAALEALRVKELESRQELESTQNQLNLLLAQISDKINNPKPNYDELERERQALQESEAHYQKAFAQQKEAAIELEMTTQALQFARQSLEEARQQQAEAIADVTRQQSHLGEVVVKLHELTKGQSYDKICRDLEEEKQNLANQLKAAEASYQTARERTIQAEEKYKQASVAAAIASEKKQQLSASWEKVLEAANFTEETFLEAAASAIEQEAFQEAIANYEREKIRLETLLKEVKDSIAERTTDEAAIKKHREMLRTAKEQRDRTLDKKSELSVWIQIASGKLQQAQDLAEKQQILTESEETYHAIAQNLKANEFQAYLLEHLEMELVERATLLLRELTDSRYALSTEDGEYWVEDNWNGGEKRRVRTLSGGETFATSLAMALALSEKLSMGAHLGSLFLDEGFGTLDAETLESVTQILESLRQQSRMIGVITHVRSLGERLPAQVKVFKSPAGSRIEVEML